MLTLFFPVVTPCPHILTCPSLFFFRADDGATVSLQAANTAVGYVRAQGERREEHLVDIPNHVRVAVKHGVHHGVVIMLAAAQL